MTTTAPKREYMIAAVEEGRFHRISRPMVFMEGSVGEIQRIVLSDRHRAAQDKYSRIGRGRLDILAGDTSLPGEGVASCRKSSFRNSMSISRTPSSPCPARWSSSTGRGGRTTRGAPRGRPSGASRPPRPVEEDH